jgi:hypothetical protein
MLGRAWRSRSLVFEWQAWIALPWLLAELLLIASGGGQLYHVYPLVPPLVLSGLWLIRRAERAASFHRRWLATGALVLVFAPAMVGVSGMLTQVDTPDRSHWDALINTIRNATSPDEPIFVMGWDGPRLLALAERRNASRYFYPTPLYTRGYASGERWAALQEELESNGPPRLLALDTGGLPSAVNGKPTVEWVLGWLDYGHVPGPLQDRTPYPQLTSLKQYILDHYQLAECRDETLCLLVYNR